MVERKDLADLVHSFTTERTAFVNRLRLMSRCPHRLLVITAALSDLKSSQTCIGGSPNRITQSLIAALAGLQASFLCSETHELGEELVGSYLYRSISIIGLRATTTAASSPTTISKELRMTAKVAAVASNQGADGIFAEDR